MAVTGWHNPCYARAWNQATLFVWKKKAQMEDAGLFFIIHDFYLQFINIVNM